MEDSVFTISAKKGYLEIIHYFVHDKKIDISTIKDDNNNTLLHLAAKNNKTVLAGYLTGYLISKGADIEAKNNDGETPFEIAIENKEKWLAEFLIKKKVQLEQKSSCKILTSEKPENLGSYVLKKGKDSKKQHSKRRSNGPHFSKKEFNELLASLPTNTTGSGFFRNNSAEAGVYALNADANSTVANNLLTNYQLGFNP